MIGRDEQIADDLELDQMAWTIPQFSRATVDRAGELYANDKITLKEYRVVDNWRTSHNYPLNIFQIDLRRRAKSVDTDCIVAQRIKRLSSIREKLKRSSSRLSQLQDIGGCRAILQNVNMVKDLVLDYENLVGHHLEYVRDYIENPQNTGYRGIHIVYKYHGKKTEFHNLKIEIQIRTLDQHAWATAVETVGLFTHQALKSNKGSKEWLRFFALMGNAIAFKENCNPVPGVPQYDDGLRFMLNDYMEKLQVSSTLHSYGNALHQVQEAASTDHYFVMVINPYTKELNIEGFKKQKLAQANEYYWEMEKQVKDTGLNAVLVSVDKITDLKRAYPNYFLDTSMFMDLVEWATGP